MNKIILYHFSIRCKINNRELWAYGNIERSNYISTPNEYHELIKDLKKRYKGSDLEEELTLVSLSIISK